jgi:ABC-type uncharacterized transport system permease subunit
MYLPVMIFIQFMKAAKFLMIVKLEKQLWKSLYQVDEVFASIFLGFHFAKFPESILNACFRCKKKKGKKVSRDSIEKELAKIFANKDSFNFSFFLIIVFAFLYVITFFMKTDILEARKEKDILFINNPMLD